MVAWWIVGGLVVAVVAGGLLWRPWRAARRRARLQEARALFRLRREWLEARFVQVAAASGKPRGLRWANCQFDDGVTYARSRRTGALSAFVGVTISFEAVEGGPMEDVEAVGNLRAATAVFTHGPDGWETQGRVVFNLEPERAIAHFRHELEPLLP